MNHIIADTVGNCWVECIKNVMTNGNLCHDEDVDILELEGVSIKITKPKSNDPIIDRYGDHYIIEHTLQKFEPNVIMPDRPFTYGALIYHKKGVDQFNWLVQRLKKKRESKSATISLLTAGDNNPNLPCLTTLDAKIRQGKLNLQFFYRSQNVLGRQYANFLALAALQQRLATALSVENGFLAGYIASAHIYKYDFLYAQKIIDNQQIQIKDQFYSSGPESIRRSFQ